MRVGLIDVDGHNFPNLPLMKISAYHKARGDTVEWYEPIMGEFDLVYMSKVFSWSDDYEYPIYAKEVRRGGTGYCIRTENGKEIWDETENHSLPDEVEHTYPDYSLYGITNTAYGFLSRGCPRNCAFCIVGKKEGCRSHKVADLAEFWRGQKYIELLDPNILACPEWADLLDQLHRSGAWVDFNQGLDIRMMDEKRAKAILSLKIKRLHFAFDRYEDGDRIKPKFEMFKQMSGIEMQRLVVYVLCNYNTTIEQDLERIYWLRGAGYGPYVMLYDKEHMRRDDPRRKMQRWCNAKWAFKVCPDFADYRG